MFYQFARWVFGVALRLLFKIEAVGFDKIPEEGAVVICSNHISWWDPCLLAYKVERPVHFMAKKDLFKIPVLSFLFKKLNAFPVNRGKADVGAIKHALYVLKDGHALGVFPEGTRQKSPTELGQGHAGAALLAMKGTAPIVPIAVKGEYRFRNTVRISCGEPFMLVPSGGKLSEELARGSEKVMCAIKDLWEALAPREMV